MEATIKFQIGQTVTARSACDYNCIFSWVVTDRTNKFITVSDGRNSKRVGVTVRNGVEKAYPQGKFSMAPVISAEKAVK